jgi:uncharacterized protein (DUF2132 family)
MRRDDFDAPTVAATKNPLAPFASLRGVVRMNASNDPLHGVTLERLLTELVAQFGWEELGERIDIRCFRFEPSIKSSLVFLRKTPWARARVEELYVRWKTGRDTKS